MIRYSHLTADDIQTIIEKIPFFSFLEPGEAELLMGAHLHILGYDTGEFLVQEGGSDRSFFLLLHGFASVVKEGAAIPMAELHPGDFFGEVAFLTGRKRITNVIVHPQAASPSNLPPFTLPEHILKTIFSVGGKTAQVMRMDAEILPGLDPSMRIRIKDAVIEKLSERVDEMVEKVESLTGEHPEVDVDANLEVLMRHGCGSLEMLESGRDAIIRHMVEFVERLNQQLSDAS